MHICLVINRFSHIDYLKHPLLGKVLCVYPSKETNALKNEATSLSAGYGRRGNTSLGFSPILLALLPVGPGYWEFFLLKG